MPAALAYLAIVRWLAHRTCGNQGNLPQKTKDVCPHTFRQSTCTALHDQGILSLLPENQRISVTNFEDLIGRDRTA